MLRLVGWVAVVGLVNEAVGDLRWDLLVESLLIGLMSVVRLLDGRLDILNRDSLLGTGLVHRNGGRASFLEGGLLRKWMGLRGWQVIDR